MGETTDESTFIKPEIQEALRVLANDYDIPGPFTVLQGVPGDGMANTISTRPEVYMDSLQEIDEDDELSIDPSQVDEEGLSDGSSLDHHEEKRDDNSLTELTVKNEALSSALSPVLPPQCREQGTEKKSCLSPRRENQPAIGLHLPLPPGVFNSSSLPPIGMRLAPPASLRNDDDSFVMIDQKKSSNINETENSTNEGQNSSSSDDSEGDDENSPLGLSPRYDSLSTENKKAIKEWNQRRIQEENEKLTETIMHNTSARPTSRCSVYRNQWWKSKRHYLRVFDSIPEFQPKQLNDGSRDIEYRVKHGKVISDIAPGSTIMAIDEIRIQTPEMNAKEAKKGDLSQGVIVVLRIESPIAGYIVKSVDGYPFIGPGLVSCYNEPDIWMWKVTCLNGAYVRQGLELTSVRLAVIPFGSIVRVRRKTINEMGLTRLQVEAFVDQSSDGSSSDGKLNTLSNALRSMTLKMSPYRAVESKFRKTKIVGWISEALNPLSGQTGPIVQPIDLPLPSKVRVSLSNGAVIRRGIELSSNQIGHAPRDSILTVVGQAFSQNPTDRCLQRLKLAGGGGWVSLTLNRPPPADNINVVEQIGFDSAFNPEEAGIFHIEKELLVIHEYNMHITSPNEEERQTLTNVRRSLRRMGSCVSSIHDDDENENPMDDMAVNEKVDSYQSVPTLYRSGVGDAGISSSQVSLNCGSKNQMDEPCLICLCNSRSATIVHGETGHIACCLTCARLLKGRGDKCPVCRLPIDLVIQQFWA